MVKETGYLESLMNLLTISQVSRRVDLSAYTLRYYEKMGLIVDVIRDASGKRAYKESHVCFINCVKSLKATGMPLKIIKQYGEAYLSNDKDSMQEILKVHRKKILEDMAAFKEHLVVVEQRIMGEF